MLKSYKVKFNIEKYKISKNPFLLGLWDEKEVNWEKIIINISSTASSLITNNKIIPSKLRHIPKNKIKININKKIRNFLRIDVSCKNVFIIKSIKSKGIILIIDNMLMKFKKFI